VVQRQPRQIVHKTDLKKKKKKAITKRAGGVAQGVGTAKKKKKKKPKTKSAGGVAQGVGTAKKKKKKKCCFCLQNLLPLLFSKPIFSKFLGQSGLTKMQEFKNYPLL
jgi:hypothetical protein